MLSSKIKMEIEYDAETRELIIDDKPFKACHPKNAGENIKETFLGKVNRYEVKKAFKRALM